MRFLTQLFLNINLSVFYSLSAIRHERELKCVHSVSEVKTNVIKRMTSVQLVLGGIPVHTGYRCLFFLRYEFFKYRNTGVI